MSENGELGPDDWDFEWDVDDDSAELEAEAEVNALPVVDEPDAPTMALQPDGSTLTLTGPGAGRLQPEVQTSSSDNSDASVQLLEMRDRDGSLDGGGPLVMFHRPHVGAADVPRLIASVIGATRGRLNVAAITPLPTLTATSNQSWLTSCALAAVRIADPLCFKHDADLVQTAYSARAARNWPRLVVDPSAVADVLEAQRTAGANLLLTPGRMLTIGRPQQSLDDVCTEADEVLALLQRGERLALNLTLPTEWLTDPGLRGLLLDQLLDQEQFDTWYVRVLWPTNPSHPQQPTRLELLEGYKRLAQLADDEDRKLLLPQTGLTGWLQLAFGATGFGTSPTGSGHGFRRQQGGGGGYDRVERYFEPSLLHVVERAAHDVIRRTPGYVQCTCPYCAGLHTGSGAWNHTLADFHHAYWCGRLADPGRRPAGAIRRTVRAAVREASAARLTGTNNPAHLPAWDRLL